MHLLPLLRLGEVRVSLPVLERRSGGTQFVEQRARTIMNPPEATGMHFWSLNPYVGCEFGCSYCYARLAHRYVVERARDSGQRLLEQEWGWEAFERVIFVKRRADVLAALDRDLPRIRRRNEGLRQTIAIGTATDPYQPAERKFAITRAVLVRLTSERGLRVGLVTKSPLVCRDIDLLRDLQRQHHLTVHVSLITTDKRIVRAFEARTPLPHARFRALNKLVASQINAGLIVAPVLPGLTDSKVALRRLFRAAATAGARFVHASPLRVSGAVRGPFFPVLERHFPDLAARYRQAYAQASEAPEDYRNALQERVQDIARQVGLPLDTSFDASDSEPAQLSFWSPPTAVDE